MDNQIIKMNLRKLCENGANVEIRVPYVPDCNEEELVGIAEFLQDLQIIGVRVLPYHNYAGSKYSALGMENTLPGSLPTDEEIGKAKETIRRITGIHVVD